MKYILFPLLTLLFFNACSLKHDVNVQQRTSSEKLYSLIVNSSSSINKNEAKKVTKDVLSQSLFLARKYEVTTPALFHNTLVNMGIKQKGLCYHYARDLRTFLNPKQYRSFKIKTIVANRAEYFEHTALLLTRDDISFEHSIVLDAWRNTGDLYFSKVVDDTRYVWELK